MCLQDIQIARATTPYPRSPAYLGGIVKMLAANPRRFALVIPSSNTDSWQWNHTGNTNALGALLPTYITGDAVGAAADTVLPPVILTLPKHGMVVTMELWLYAVNGSFVGEIIEVLFNEDTPPLNIRG